MNEYVIQKFYPAEYHIWQEIWSDIQPHRAMACAFNLEYLLVGGKDQRLDGSPNFMWYDWMMGGWGARNGADGYNASAPIFGVQYGTQPSWTG